MKRVLLLLVIALMAVLTACSSGEAPEAANSDDSAQILDAPDTSVEEIDYLGDAEEESADVFESDGEVIEDTNPFSQSSGGNPFG